MMLKLIPGLCVERTYLALAWTDIFNLKAAAQQISGIQIFSAII